MRALSLIEPWATLIKEGRKTIETRSWPSTYRGPLAIHASKTKPDRVACHEFGLYPDGMYPGTVVCIVEMTGCFKFDMFSLARIPAREIPYGDYSRGRYGFNLQLLHVLENPIPAKGSLSIWEWHGFEWRSGIFVRTGGA